MLTLNVPDNRRAIRQWSSMIFTSLSAVCFPIIFFDLCDNIYPCHHSCSRERSISNPMNSSVILAHIVNSGLINMLPPAEYSTYKIVYYDLQMLLYIHSSLIACFFCCYFFFRTVCLLINELFGPLRSPTALLKLIVFTVNLVVMRSLVGRAGTH